MLNDLEIIDDEIESIEEYCHEETYDIEVENEPHNFIADNFVVHNSHSSAYTVVSYQNMFLKYYYPLEYWCATLTLSTKDEIPIFIREVISEGIKIYEIDINHANADFTIYNDGIMFGMSHVNYVGATTVTEILKNKPFKSIKDFCERVPKRNSNKRVIEMLIKSHAFDSLIKDEWVEEGSNKQIAITQQFANERELSFDYIDYNDKKTQHETRVECYNIDWTQTVKAKFKKVAMRGAVDVGTYLKFKDQKNDITRVWGFVTKVTKKTSQNGNSYYQIMLSDEFGNQINARIPTYSKRNDPYIYMFENGEYGTKVSSFENTVKQLGNVYQGNINKSSWKGMEFFDFTSIHLIGNIWE